MTVVKTFPLNQHSRRLCGHNERHCFSNLRVRGLLDLFGTHANSKCENYLGFFFIFPRNNPYGSQAVDSTGWMIHQTVLATIVGGQLNGLFCYFGNLVTAQFIEVADIAYLTIWYDYPLPLQPFVMLMMARAQKPKLITGFKMTRCTLESFKNVS